MKKILCPLYFFIPIFAFSAADHREQFYNQWGKGDFAAMGKILESWKNSSPNDVEMLAAFGNYYDRKAGNESLLPSADPYEAEEVVVYDPAPPPAPDKPVPQNHFEAGLMGLAAGCWKKAVWLHPWRLDIRLKLAQLFQDKGDFEGQYNTLADALQYADKHRKELRWDNNAKLPASDRKFMPGIMQVYIAYYLGRHRPECGERALRLAKLSLTFYPNNPSVYNSIAVYYSSKGDWEHALKYLLIASRKDRNNGLILNNIGNILMGLDKKKEAKIYYRRVVRLNGDPENVSNARLKLRQMEEN